ncbi:MAG: flagellar hook-associated protein FlgL [Gammaproteobacteria bacterium]|jgi:flagellar hook-associated protein 3 FlgL
MRISDAQRFDIALNNMFRLQENTAKFQTQISTGRKILTPADDPVAAARVLLISERVAASKQYDRNADFAELNLQQQEGAVASANEAMQRIRELTIQGKNTILTDADRRSITTEMRQRLGEIKSLANSRNASGEFIFSGSLVNTQAFTNDSSGSVVYNGDQTSREVKISEFRTVTDGFTGHEAFAAIRNGNGTYVTDLAAGNTGSGQIVPGGVVDKSAYQAHDFRISFTGPGTYDVIDDTVGATVLAAQAYTDGAAITFNGIQLTLTGTPATGDEFLAGPSQNQSVFETVERLIATLESPTARAADAAVFQNDLDRALGDIDQTMDRFREVQGVVGARRNTVESQRVANEDLRLQLETVRSRLEDADLVEAVSRLAQESNALQAAQAAFVRVQGLSLFNFL